MLLGIEIGGTKLQLGLGPGDGSLTGLWRGRVELTAGPDGIRRQIVAAVPELLSSAGIDPTALLHVGVGFGGPVDDRRRLVIKSHQVPGWDDFPLAEWLEQALGVPAALGNDADLAGLAEATFGAARGFDPVFYITIGSGIGGGLIAGGRVYRGTGLGAAEIGHLRCLTPDGFATLEDLASGWAIERRGGATVAELAERRRNGDAAAFALFTAAWSHLAEAICSVVALVCPARVVIGGGVSLVGDDVLFAPLRRLVAERVFRPFAHCFDIVPVALGEEVVVHGALALARQKAGPG